MNLRNIAMASINPVSMMSKAKHPFFHLLSSSPESFEVGTISKSISQNMERRHREVRSSTVTQLVWRAKRMKQASGPRLHQVRMLQLLWGMWHSLVHLFRSLAISYTKLLHLACSHQDPWVEGRWGRGTVGIMNIKVISRHAGHRLKSHLCPCDLCPFLENQFPQVKECVGHGRVLCKVVSSN